MRDEYQLKALMVLMISGRISNEDNWRWDCISRSQECGVLRIRPSRLLKVTQTLVEITSIKHEYDYLPRLTRYNITLFFQNILYSSAWHYEIIRLNDLFRWILLTVESIAYLVILFFVLTCGCISYVMLQSTQNCYDRAPEILCHSKMEEVLLRG